MAHIKVNNDQWNALSQAEQETISKGLRDSGSLKAEDKLVGDASVHPFDENTILEPMWNPLKDICKAACDTTAAAAWCIAAEFLIFFIKEPIITIIYRFLGIFDPNCNQWPQFKKCTKILSCL